MAGSEVKNCVSHDCIVRNFKLMAVFENQHSSRLQRFGLSIRLRAICGLGRGWLFLCAIRRHGIFRTLAAPVKNRRSIVVLLAIRASVFSVIRVLVGRRLILVVVPIVIGIRIVRHAVNDCAWEECATGAMFKPRFPGVTADYWPAAAKGPTHGIARRETVR